MKIICDSQQKQFVSWIGKHDKLEFSSVLKDAIEFDDNESDRAWFLAYKAEWLGYGHFYVTEVAME